MSGTDDATTRGGTREDVDSLAGAWALDALDDDERALYERHLQSSPAARDGAEQLRETASRLGVTTPAQPPPHLRASILAAIADTPQERSAPAASVVAGARPASSGRSVDAPAAPGAPVDLAEQRRRRRGRPGYALLAAAACAVVAVGGVTYAVDARRDADRLSATVAAQERYQEQVESVLTSAGAQVVRVDATGGGAATVVHAGTRAVVLADLPPVPDRQYQLWFVEGQTVRSAGLLPAPADGRSTFFVPDTGGASGLGISVEPVGGSQQPTTQPIVLAPIPA
ncbi:hypothetical protein GTR02_11755 [Kineococcus sp. R8]|uniref:anti-sigma factor n=1 Tax=Kineococcus siccus TaxID=2696567 RepID=UPI0014121C7D|nr:anti-sigma factor [Kineococcus siccus]NAZ82495.1 hypothetical protein [Kineococcus siccus]